MNTTLEEKVNERYIQFMKELDINKHTGILGKISNPRYKDCNLRFSGLPYIGNKYCTAKKKILFVGLDIGEDERCEFDTYHSISSKKSRIVGSTSGSIGLAFNPHFSGTYAMALYILKDVHSWGISWEIFKNHSEKLFKTIIDSHNENLPIDVLDYITFTNIHKFVDVARGCDLQQNKKCWKKECSDHKLNKNRSGADNRKWYNHNEEIQLLLDEIKILNPNIIYFQGHKSYEKMENHIQQINLTSEIWIADHPSAWRFRANTPDYVNSSRIRIMPKVGL